MKIAFNPSTVAALTTPPNNKDITFDLRGHSIFARGVEFKGTDTNTWRDVKINNVSIGSHTLDLRNGSNTTLTNTNGVVTINSTWRPVVDNLTSDSTTSSLSAKQGKVLKALIDDKSNSDHNHDGKYLRLSGQDTMQGNLYLHSYGKSYIGKGLGDKSGADFTEANIVIRSWWGISFKSADNIVRTYIDTRTGNIGTKGVLNAVGAVIQGRVYNDGDDEGIIINPAPNGYAGLILGTYNGERSVFYLKKGNPFWRYNNGSTNLDIYHPKKSGTIALTSDIPNKDSWNYDDRYLKLTGGWMSGDINFGGDNKIYWGRNTDSASISFKNDEDGDANSYMSFVTSDNGNEYFRWSHNSGTTNTEWMALRSDGLRVRGTKVSLEGHTHDGKYLRLSGQDTMQGNLYLHSYGKSYIGKGLGDKSGADFTEANIVIRSWWGISFKSADNIVRTYIDTRTGNIGTKGVLNAVGAVIQGRVYNDGDDEGIIINPAPNGYAGLILGTYNGERSVFYLKKGNPFWRYNNGSTNLDIYHPKKSGTIALTSDIPNKDSWNYDDRYLKLTGGWMSGDINFGGDNKIYWGRNTDSASISFKNDEDGDANSYMSFVTSDNGNEYFRWSHNSGTTNTEWMALRSDGLRVRGTKVSLEGHTHDDRYYTKAESNAKYITDIATSVNKLTFTRNGSNIIRDITVNVVYSQGHLTNIPNKDATTKASPGLLIYDSYNQTIGTNPYSSVLSINTGGTIQIAGNWGDDWTRNLYWRSQSDRNVADYPWKSWRTILDSENYSSTLDSRYYTESEVNSLLDAKLNRQNLSYGNWNPRGWNLAADYHYNGGDISISENNGKMYVSVNGCFWQNEGQYRVLDTSDIGDIRDSVALHQYLSATDAAWYPLVWGGAFHNNTSDSTGSIYKSYDKLCWQTSSQTLYATNIQTNNIKNLSIGGGIYWNPYVESASDGSDAASITLVRPGVAGGTTLVLSQIDTIQFKTKTAARLYHNSYPILTTQNTFVSINHKGYINGTEITQVNNSDTVDGEHASSFVRAGYYESNDLNKLDTYSFIRSVNSNVSSTSPKGNTGWYNVIQLVHKNGAADGPSYIGQIALGMTTNTNDMFFRGKRTDPWKTVIHSGNYTEFINNYYWANVKISTSSSTTTSPTVSNLTATNSIRLGDIHLEYTNEINSYGGLLINHRSSADVDLCQGGGNVCIGATLPTQKLDVRGNIITKGLGIQPYYLSKAVSLPTIRLGDDQIYRYLEISATTEISCIIADRAGSTGERGILITFNKGYDGQIILLKDLYSYGGENGYFWVMPSGCKIMNADNSSILVDQYQVSRTYNDGRSRFLVYSSVYSVWIEFLCSNTF